MVKLSVRKALAADSDYTGSPRPELSIRDDALALIYYDAHLLLEPESCFVLVKGDDIVGCVRATPDTLRFADRYERAILPKLPRDRFPPADSAAFRHHSLEDREAIEQVWTRAEELRKLPFLDRFPAHFHIGVDEAYRGEGWGARLLEAVDKDWGERRLRGGFVQPENEKARRWFERLGWHALAGHDDTLVKVFV